MPDATARNKRLFWLFAGTVFLLAAVPSWVLLEKARDYYRFLTGWDPGTLRPSSPRAVPHARAGKTPDLHFVEFRLAAPKARAVRLGGSFNQWRPETMPMRRERNGVWKALLPLPAGRYAYAFEVDGEWIPDPRAPSGETAGRPASWRTVP